MSQTSELGAGAQRNPVPAAYRLGFRQLPKHFLGLDETQLWYAANRERSLWDLEGANERMQQSAVVGIFNFYTSSHYAPEAPNSRHHIARGSALAWLLIEQSNIQPALPSAEKYETILTTPNTSETTQQLVYATNLEGLTAARSDAVYSRRNYWQGWTPEECLENLRGRIDETLDLAGLGNSFEAALDRLHGTGLELPTRPLEAKCGAALLALSVGYVQSAVGVGGPGAGNA